MENDEEPYRVDLASPPRSSHSNRLGQRNIQSYLSHGAGKAHDDGHEETPLLAQENDRLSENESPEPVDTAGGAQQWSGANDFAGQSWWNRPSVSSHSRETNGLLIQCTIGQLAAATLHTIYPRLRWDHRPKDQLNT